jgi:glutathione S-transferase
MKLYTNLFSPNARKVHAVANELGIELDTHTVDLRAGEQRTPEYLALNPNGKVPTLVDGDTVLWESNAIICYLAGKGDTELWPKSAKRYDILRWISSSTATIRIKESSSAPPRTSESTPPSSTATWQTRPTSPATPSP